MSNDDSQKDVNSADNSEDAFEAVPVVEAPVEIVTQEESNPRPSGSEQTYELYYYPAKDSNSTKAVSNESGNTNGKNN